MNDSKRQNGDGYKSQQRYPISANDIKRTFAKQYESGVNTHEYDKFLDVLRSYCTPDVLGVISHPRGNPQGVSYLELSGLEVMADYIFRSFTSAPDSMCFIHDTQVVGHEDGSSLIVCKFSVSGSRLYTVTAETEGRKLQDPPALRVLHTALEKQASHGALDGQSSGSRGTSQRTTVQPVLVNAVESYSSHETAIKQSVVFKGASNKYDRYKKQKVSTLGAYVNYKEFSETSLKVKTKPDKSTSQTTQQNQSISSASTLVDGYRDDEVIIAGREVSFGFSELLPMPVKMHVVGMQKFHVNADDKVYKIEFIVAYR